MLTQTLALHPYNVLEFVFAFVAGFGALLIWHLPRYRELAVFFIWQCLLMLLNNREQLRAPADVYVLTPVFTLLKGPLLYLFVRAVVNEKRPTGLRRYGHFMPALIALPLTVDPQFVIMLGTLSQFAYLGAMFHLLHRYHRAAADFRSDAAEVALPWLSGVMWLLLAQVLAGLLRLNLQPRLSPAIANAWFTFDIALLLGICCFLLFKALRQPPLYDDMLGHEAVGEEENRESPGREIAEAGIIFASLGKRIREARLHLQPGLCVEDIARVTGLQIKDVSWAINQGGRQNFNEYINRLRVDEVKQRIVAGDLAAKSLLELAMAAGFNSKSTFNAVFKRETGMTPTQFAQSLSGVAVQTTRV